MKVLMNIFRDSRWLPTELTLSPTTTDRSFISSKNKFTRNLFIEFTPRITYPPTTRIIKQQSSSPILWNGSSRPLPKITPHPIRKKLALLLRRRSARLRSRNQRIVEEMKRRNRSSFIARKPHKQMPSRRACHNQNPRINASSAARQDTGKKTVQTPRNLSSYVLSISRSPMLKKKSLQKRLFRRVGG